ncbi:MAG: ABC transporter permease [Candidatus Campbellbacteria bacterium]|nr:ABC transporter permease [Candidatus Campbellbacteria bacterium]
MKLFYILKSIIHYTISVLLLLAVWQLVIIIWDFPKFILPAPLDVFSTLWNEREFFVQPTLETLFHAGVGGLIGIVAGTITGFLIAYSKILLYIFEPYIVIFQSFPRESLIPLFIVWFGFGSISKIINAFLLPFFPFVIIVMTNLLNTRQDYIELMRNHGFTKWQEFLYCRIPNSIYNIAGSLKIIAPFALIAAILAEFFGGGTGLGHVIISSGSDFRLDRTFASLVILSFIGLILLTFIKFLQEVVLKRFRHEQ